MQGWIRQVSASRGRETGKGITVSECVTVGRLQLPSVDGKGRLPGETSQLKQEDEKDLDRQEGGIGWAVLKWLSGHLFAFPKECCFYLIIPDKFDLYHWAWRNTDTVHQPDSFLWWPLWEEATKLTSIWSNTFSLWNYALANLKNKILLKTC